MLPVELVSAGEAFEDLVFHGLPRLPRSGEELRTRGFTRTLGGGTLITALAAARLGTRVEIVSALSDEAVRRATADGVRTWNLRRRGEAHAVSVALSTKRERSFVTFEGANEALEARVLTALGARVRRSAHVHVAMGPRDLRSWARLLARLRAQGIGTSWDFGWHESLPARRGFHELLQALDWVFVNEREARHYVGASTLARALARWRRLARGTIVKRGAHGAVAVEGELVAQVPAPRVRVVDTTGAGDAFNGGFLAALLKGQSLAECLRLGVLVGSLSTRAAGGIEALPSRREISSFGRPSPPTRRRSSR